MAIPLRKTLQGRRAVVVGSGPGGLAAAASLAVRGARVVVIDSLQEPGGSLRDVMLEGAAFPPWPVQVTDPAPLSQLFAQADLRFSDFVAMERAATLRRFHFPGEVLDLPTDPTEFLATLAERDGGAAQALGRVLRRAARVESAIESARETIARDLAPARVRPLARLRGAAADAGVRSAGGIITRELGASPAARVFMQFCMEAGIDPFRSGSLALGAAARAWRRGGWVPREGLAAMRAALLRLCALLHVKFHLGSHVERIELRAGRVRRITGEGFRPMATSIVVSAADALYTIEELFAERSSSMAVRRRLLAREPAWSRLVVRLLLSELPAGVREETISVFPSADFQQELHSIQHWKVPAPSPTVQVHLRAAGEGRWALTMVSRQPPLGDRWRWNAHNRLEQREAMLATLRLGGLEISPDSIVAESAATPADVAEASGNRFGTTDGVAVNSWQHLQDPVLPRVAEIPGLYLVSSSIHPGPGLTNLVHCGMLAAAQAARDAE